LNAKGLCLNRLGRYSEEMKCYAKALEIDPKNADTWQNKALVEDTLGLRNEAAKSYRKFIEIAPAQYSHQVQSAAQRLKQLEKNSLFI
jgi:tetratricopeptide (TPR) repeat protein